MLASELLQGFTDELSKIAARRGLKEIAKLVSGGNLSKATQLAKTPGVLKATNMAGSAIKDLGQGSEGLATLVAHPQHGVSVRKLYDPKGMASQELIKRKEMAGKAIGANPHVAQFHGTAQTPHGQGTMHFNEYVPQTANPTPKPAGGPTPENRAAMENLPGVRQAKAQTIRANRAAGFSGGAADVRYGNMVEHAPGQFKTIDYMPAQRGDFHSTKGTGLQSNVLSPSPTGRTLLNPNQSMGGTSSVDLKRTMLGGKAPAPSTYSGAGEGWSSVMPKSAPAKPPTRPTLPGGPATAVAKKPPNMALQRTQMAPTMMR